MEELFTFSQSDFDQFATLSGDHNPIHVDAAYAARTRFGRPVAHGMFLFSHICAALYRWQPQRPLRQQTMTFTAPTYTDEANILRLEQTDPQTITTTFIRPDGVFGLQGTALLGEPLVPTNPPSPIHNPQSFRGLRVGQLAQKTQGFTAVDIADYRTLIHDDNPQWQTAVPLGLLGGMVSDLLGTHLPGRGTNWLKQQYTFLADAKIGELVTAVVQISRIRPEKALINLTTTLTGQHGQPLVIGEALVLATEFIRQEEMPMS